jgi:predicted nucleic acid-binding Zn ribbon protein
VRARAKQRGSSLARASAQALHDWRVLPEQPDPGRRQHHVGTVIHALFEKLGVADRFHYEEVAAGWRSIVGEFAAGHSHPLRLQHHVLTIAVGQSSILWTLDRSKATILARLQEKFGADVIRDLKFRAG